MPRAQRIILIVYCLLLAYCCIWVPWHVAQGQDYVRAGYGWLWSGPSNTEIEGILTAPDLPIIGLRLLAVTTISAAAWIAAAKAGE
jgi:hypothetical protein